MVGSARRRCSMHFVRFFDDVVKRLTSRERESKLSLYLGADSVSRESRHHGELRTLRWMDDTPSSLCKRGCPEISGTASKEGASQISS